MSVTGDSPVAPQPQRARGRRWTVSSWIVLALLIAAGAGLGVGMYLVPAPQPRDIPSGLQATSVPVQSQDFSDSVSVNVVFVMGQERPLITQAMGTVTAPFDTPLSLSSGSVAMSVDSHPVIGLHTSIPLFRDLVVGDRGEDVKALNDELSRLGRGSLSSDEFTAQTREAWAGLLRDFGVAERSRGLSVADVLWLPDTEVAVESWSALAGTSVSPGATVGQVKPRLRGMDLSIDNGQSVLAGDRVLTVFGVTVPVEDLSTSLSDDFLEKVEATSNFAQIVAFQGPYETTGTWALVTPISVLRIPPSAIFAIDGRHGCVQTGTQGIPVTLVGSGLGATLVLPDKPTTISEVAIGPGITATDC